LIGAVRAEGPGFRGLSLFGHMTDIMSNVADASRALCRAVELDKCRVRTDGVIDPAPSTRAARWRPVDENGDTLDSSSRPSWRARMAYANVLII
jgi:hypothetical protein